MFDDKVQDREVLASFSKWQEHAQLEQLELKSKISSAFTSFMLLLAAGGMELCWLYAIAAFFMNLAGSAPFPYLQAISAFWLAAILTFLSRGLGWRIFQILLLHLFGLAVAVLRVLYVFYIQATLPFFDRSWLLGIFSSAEGALEIFILFIVIFFSASFYFAGVALSHRFRRPNVHLLIARRLDLGIGVFISLLLLNIGFGSTNLMTTFFLYPFFFFGMLALSLARSRREGQKEYLPGQRWVGLTLTFSIAVFAFAAGIILLLLPYLTIAAETGLTAMKWVFRPLFYSFLLPILKFMFGARPMQSPPESMGVAGDSAAMMPDAVPESFLGKLFAKILGYGISGLAGLVLLVAAGIAGWGLWRLFCWLFSRSPRDKEPGDFQKQMALWLAVLRFYWGKMLIFVRRIAKRGSTKEGSEAAEMYKKLLAWGRSSGFPRLHYETPHEYGMRLVSCFPAVKNEVMLITNSFNREIYGGIPVDEKQVPLLRRARRKLSSPQLWFARFFPGKR
ncbi:MAG: DUF4129 domain-containing protein [Firmicutes bacterium]|nr:DUF4129 domain-containing protein [Bacillota bacterium]